MRRDIFHAIADPTRRTILTLLTLQAMTPNALAEHFAISRQAISKHVQILLECELIKPEYQGREIYYSLEANKMKEIDQWLNQFRSLWKTKFKQLDTLLHTLQKQTT
ncbi:MAG TPA: metalloregulator ArsR/SmtB family transcription factor [Chitinophagaceae bacterium]|nr:metalloregulator ArsR/SmtB family transcription factor [Chitinophagaceae bacterium]